MKSKGMFTRIEVPGSCARAGSAIIDAKRHPAARAPNICFFIDLSPVCLIVLSMSFIASEPFVPRLPYSLELACHSDLKLHTVLRAMVLRLSWFREKKGHTRSGCIVSSWRETRWHDRCADDYSRDFVLFSNIKGDSNDEGSIND